MKKQTKEFLEILMLTQEELYNYIIDFLKVRNIKYKAKDEADKYHASDYFKGEGSGGITDVVTINSIIPDTDSVGYVTTPEAIGNDLMIAIDDESAGTLQGQLSWNYGVSLSNISTIKKNEKLV